MSEPRQRTVVGAAANTEFQVFTVPYPLADGRAKAILRRIRIFNSTASAMVVKFWDEDIDGTLTGTPQRGTNAAPIIPFINVAASSDVEIIFEGEANFCQYGLACETTQNAAHIQCEYDMQL